MEYRLLRFEENFNAIIPYISDLWQPDSSEISDYESDKEYEHLGFEYEVNSLETVCRHAAAMVRRLKRFSEDETAKNALARDYRNALKCLALGNHGYRERIDNFTRYMLLSDWETVTAAILKAHEYNERRKQDELINVDCIPDYGKFLIKMGDQALFEENNLYKALGEYSIAVLDWRSKYDECNKIYSLEDESKRKIRSYIDLYASINEDRYLGEDDSFLNEDEKKIIAQYKKVIEKNNQHIELTEEIEILVGMFEQHMGRVIHTPTGYNVSHPIFDSNGINTLRTIKVIIPKLYQIGYFDEIRYLAEEPKALQEELKEQAIEKIAYISETDFAWIYCAIFSESKKQWKMLTSTAKVFGDIKELKRELLIDGKVPELAYYTSRNTFSYMLPNEESDTDDANVGHFSIMHLSYMNDPKEGKVINEYLFGPEKQGGRIEATQPYVFVKCFTQLVDYLPMWKTYGDDAAGCCIVIDWNTTIKQNPGRNISLYRVCYLNKKNGVYSFRKVDNSDIRNISSLLNKLKRDITNLDKVDKEWGLSKELLGSIAFLFKESSYSYEKEARVLYSYNNYSSRIHKTKEAPPKLFVYSDYQVVIKEVILGPKFEDVYLWSPYMKMQLEKMNNKLEAVNYTRLTISEINYR